MRRSLMGFVCLLIVTAAFAKPKLPLPEASWTVMIYMNGQDAELEEAAIWDFKEMARVDTGNKINVVVLFDRLGNVEPKWEGTGHFWVRHKDLPLKKNALIHVEESVDMAAGQTLEEFLRWSVSNFPAKHYALIMWCHGSGYRDITPAPAPGEDAKTTLPVLAGATRIPAKASSFDGENELYNAELSRAARKALDELAPGRKLDVLGFDSCLMGMIETAYAMQPIADVMVASEELVPATGFDYAPWLTYLTANPDSSGLDVGKAIVDAFGAFYGKQSKELVETEVSPSRARETTLAAVDLRQIDALAKKLSLLSKAMAGNAALLKNQVAAVRGECAQFAPKEKLPYLHIDLWRFMDLLSKRDGVPPDIQAMARDVRDGIDKAVGGRNYAAANRQGAYGSRGLAIYFPANHSEFKSDPFADGSYKKVKAADNATALKKAREIDPDAIAFVHNENWADFLEAYFKEVK